MKVKKAIEALKEGKRVQALIALGSPFYYQLFMHGWIILMKQETSCAAREVERMDEEGFLTRGELSDFVIYE